MIDVSLTNLEPSPVKPLRDEEMCKDTKATILEEGSSLEPETVDSKDCVCTPEKHRLSSDCAEAITRCARVVKQHYGEDLMEAATTLQSLCNVQDTSLELIENRHRELVDIRETYQLEEVIEETQNYYNKMLRLKKEMLALTAKSKELTKRAAYVRDVRAKEQAKKDEERKRIEQLEKELEPRYASGLSN